MENLYDKIEPYLLGELEGSEKAAFQEAIEKDSQLKSSLEQHQHIMERLHAARLRFKVKTEWRKIRKPANKWWVWALAACLLALLAYWNFSGIKKIDRPQPDNVSPQLAPLQTPSQVFPPTDDTQTETLPDNSPANRTIALAKQYQQQPFPNMLRSTSSDETPSVLRTAFEAYEQGAYNTTLQLLNEVPKLQNNETALFLRGSAHFRQGNFDKAARDFEQLAESFQYKHDAHWNYVLSLWASDDARAKTLMSQIAGDQDNPFQQKAKELLKQMTKH